MSKDERSSVNPFTGKSHLDLLDDDKFLKDCYNEYYKMIEEWEILDNTDNGKLVSEISYNLIKAVEEYLAKIGRSDYTKDYYDWEFHLVANDTVNAFCMPGGKIVMFSGMLPIAQDANNIAFILGHEMAHALLDHSRTRISAQNTKDTLANVARIGSIGLSLFGLGELGAITRVATEVADVGSEFFLMKPFGRQHELEADKLGMMIVHWAGYDISNIPEFWQRVSAQGANNFDFFSTHPSDDKRIAAMRELIIEIENGKDVINTPVLSDGSSTTPIKVDNTSNNSQTFTQDSPKNHEVYNNSPDIIASETETINQKSVSKCPKCGFDIYPEDKFCINCGEKIKKEENENNLKCPTCGGIVKKEDKFCFNCGAKLNFQMNCPSCGKPVKASDKFCGNCGSKIQS